jgi:hypothetical protein
MVLNILSVVIVIIIHIVVAVFMLGGMLLTMNGYNDKAAEAAITAYGIVQVIALLINGICAFLICRIAQNKFEFGSFAAFATSVGSSIVIAGILTVFAVGIGIAFGDMAFRR